MRQRRGVLTGVIAVMAVAWGLAAGRVRRTEVQGASMEPTLSSGDYVVTLARSGLPERGEIVVMEHPSRAGLDLVKRVIGLPHEIVDVAGGQVHIDGRVLAEPWSNGPTLGDGSWTVGDGEVFLLGDNRSSSTSDGRTTGPVSTNAGWWQVRWRYWPLERFGRI